MAVVAVLFAQLKRFYIRGRNYLALIPQALQGAVNQLFMFPGESTEQKRGAMTLICGERVLYRLMKLVQLFGSNASFFFQPSAFFGQASTDHVLNCVDLDKSAICHGMRRSAHSFTFRLVVERSLVNHLANRRCQRSNRVCTPLPAFELRHCGPSCSQV